MKITLIIFLLSNLICNTTFADKVLVTIGKTGQVTEHQLEAAMLAAPFSTQFPAMDEQDQAYLRGDMLLRMARAEALYQEAIAQEKDKSLVFQQEMGNFKTALLAQRYLKNLRHKIQIPEEIEQKFATNFQDSSDALLAARSAYIAKHFTTLKNEEINKLIEQAKVQIHYELLNKALTADSVLAEGEGLTIRYGDLVSKPNPLNIDKKRINEKVDEWIKLILMAKAAVAEGENVDLYSQEYAHNLTIRLLITEKELQWIPDEKILRDYFQKNPDIGYIPERRQIGQIILGTKQEAEKIHNRILAGESLFELAGLFSIDPYGRQRSGDMGWLTEGSGTEAIERAIKKLKDNEVSDIVKTSKGWHIVVIVNRKPSERKDFAAIKDRVRQKLIAEKMAIYLQEVVSKYPLQWKIKDHGQVIKSM